MKMRRVSPGAEKTPPGGFRRFVISAISIGASLTLAVGSAYVAAQRTPRVPPASTPSGPSAAPQGQQPGRTSASGGSGDSTSPYWSPSTTTPDALPSGHKSTEWMKQHGAQMGQGCTVCHPQNRCANCHGGTTMPHPAAWLQIHGGASQASSASCTRCHDTKKFCFGCHQTQMPHAATWPDLHGKQAEQPSARCLFCHTNEQKFCTACHGVKMPHAADWSVQHRPAARANVATCQTCHTRADCSTCHKTDTQDSCRTCHTTEVTAIDRDGGHSSDQCLNCHKDNPSALGPGDDHKTVPSCLSSACHVASDLTKDSLASPPAARDYLTTKGKGPKEWPERGRHSSDDLTRCTQCHNPHDAAVVEYPPGTDTKSANCAPACHTWVSGTVSGVAGFTNASADPKKTQYSGPIAPGALLAQKPTKHSTVVAKESGCATRCHNGEHGTITICTTCHVFAISDPGTMHSTHIPFISGEQRLADPDNYEPTNAQSGCKYCHKPSSTTAPGKDVWKRACWNCHLSGHAPITPYWELPT